MSLTFETRGSDSPYIDSITRGWTLGNGSSVRPAECSWHMVFARFNGSTHSVLVGPLTKAGMASWGGEAEVLWIKFKLGTYLSHIPLKEILDKEALLPEASGSSFWLKGSPWQAPSYENVETFINRLAREDILAKDPMVSATLAEQPLEVSARTLRHRFLHTTGLTRSYIRQAERAQRAASLLEQGRSILDTVYELGYFDQPHLTRSLKQFTGYTPGQITQMHSLA